MSRSWPIGSIAAPAAKAFSFASRTSVATWRSQASRSRSLDPKWCITSPGETSAAAAIVRTVVAAMPASAKHAIAASRMRAAVGAVGVGWRQVLNACSVC